MRKKDRMSMLMICIFSTIIYSIFMKNIPDLAQHDSLTPKVTLTYSLITDGDKESLINRMTEKTAIEEDDHTFNDTETTLLSNNTGGKYPQRAQRDASVRSEVKRSSNLLEVGVVTSVRRVRENGTIDVKKYLIVRQIGSGNYGRIFLGNDVTNGDKVALKVNRLMTSSTIQSKEDDIAGILQSEEGFPVVRWSGKVGEHNVIVMDLLGLNLSKYFKQCSRKFSLRTVLHLAVQLISRLEYMHVKGYIHNDLKPRNCVVGLGDRSHVIYLVDFGLSEPVRDRDTNTTVPYPGCNRFSSINTHLSIQPSPRNDMESLGYILMSFLSGRLPWEHDTGEKMLMKKQSVPVTDICKGCPIEFAYYLKICRSLRFNEKPNYSYLRLLFKTLYKRNNFTSDTIFDWNIPSGTCNKHQGNSDRGKKTEK